MDNHPPSSNGSIRITERWSPAYLHFPTKVGDVVAFRQGLPGFPDQRRFRLRMEEAYRPFLFMDALGESPLCFVCVDTFYIRPDYDARIPSPVARRLQLTDPQDIGVFSIVTVRPDRTQITANLLSPLIINLVTLEGEQIILEGVDYPVQFRIWDTLAGAAEQETARTAG